MHRRTGVDLLTLGTELEKALRNLKKEKVATVASTMAKQGEVNQNLPVVAERPQ